MNERELSNNKINQFLLRIDLTPEVTVDFRVLAEKLLKDYGSYKTELKVNYHVNVQTVEVKRENYVIFNLGEAPNVTLKLDTSERAIILTALHYNNNSVYKEKLSHIISALRSINPEVRAQRIGMRYINVFNCPKTTDIAKILNPSEAKPIKDSLNRAEIARSMVVHEYQHGSHMTRVQCGIPNKFYPSIISNYDLVLDIDVYNVGVTPLEEWEECVSEYNHGAYDAFVSYTKETYRDSMR